MMAFAYLLQQSMGSSELEIYLPPNPDIYVYDDA